MLEIGVSLDINELDQLISAMVNRGDDTNLIPEWRVTYLKMVKAREALRKVHDDNRN